MARKTGISKGDIGKKCIISLLLGTSCKNGRHRAGNLDFGVRQSSETALQFPSCGTCPLNEYNGVLITTACSMGCCKELLGACED